MKEIQTKSSNNQTKCQTVSCNNGDDGMWQTKSQYILYIHFVLKAKVI